MSLDASFAKGYFRIADALCGKVHQWSALSKVAGRGGLETVDKEVGDGEMRRVNDGDGVGGRGNGMRIGARGDEAAMADAEVAKIVAEEATGTDEEAAESVKGAAVMLVQVLEEACQGYYEVRLH